jgi:hypothetical protein
MATFRSEQITTTNFFDFSPNSNPNLNQNDKKKVSKEQNKAEVQNQSEQVQTTTVLSKPREYLAYQYRVIYTDRFQNDYGRTFNDGGISLSAEIKGDINGRNELDNAYFERFIKTYTIPFSIESVKDICSYHIVDHPDPTQVKIKDINRRKWQQRRCPVVDLDKTKFYIGETNYARHDVFETWHLKVPNRFDFLYLEFDKIQEYLKKGLLRYDKPHEETLNIMNQEKTNQATRIIDQNIIPSPHNPNNNIVQNIPDNPDLYKRKNPKAGELSPEYDDLKDQNVF